MSKPETMMIDDVKYIRADQAEVKPTTKQIVVLQRGWIVVGDVEKNDAEVKINNCSVIRVWGTSKGLGELAENGKTPSTKLDPCPPVIAHPLSVVLYMNVNEENWK
jgi:hypothetical protein